MYTVFFFGSHPDDNNDDCWSGKDFATLEEAKSFYETPTFAESERWCTAFIVLDGPDLPDQLIRPNPEYRPDDGDDWRMEIAHQAGMMGGCEAYNEAMGY